MLPNQICSYCENPESIISIETCCSGCSKLQECDRNYYRDATEICPSNIKEEN